ncbi:MAG: tRNA lysidine(34) synthetase TilS [Candidatus Marinimicrobia bacterium]|nr:tRNA lysidine(34) synthetase TilS [Candidatus Neomarinimicrobiota bacterium]
MLTINSFKQSIESSPWFHPNLKIVVACSGGVDSTVLLHLLNNIQNIQLSVVHFDHHLRGAESRADKEFITEYATSLQQEVHIISEEIQVYADEHSLSLEEAGSRRRRETFLALKEDLDFDLVATGHHQDDQIETVLLNLYSGTGIAGLAGTSSFQGELVRPLIPFTRAEITEYARINKVNYRIDQSNSDISFMRNNIRVNIVPSMLKLNSSNIRASFNRITSLGNVLNEILQSKIETVDIKEFKGVYKPKIALGLGDLSDYFSPIQKAIFDRAFQLISLMPQGLSAFHFEALKTLIPEDAIGKEVQLPAHISAVRNRRNIIFYRREDYEWTPQKMTQVTQEQYPFFQFDYCIAEMKHHITDPHYFWYVHHLESYQLRCIKAGDRMKVDTSGREVSVNQVLQSARVAPHLKEYYPVLEYQGEILWVPGIRTADAGMVAGINKKENEIRHCIRVQFQEGTCE